MARRDIHFIPLSVREITLIRCGLMARMDRLREREEPECIRSYEDSRELLKMLWPYVRYAKPEEVL